MIRCTLSDRVSGKLTVACYLIYPCYLHRPQLSDNQHTFHRNIPGFNILMRILITDAAMTINNNYVVAAAATTTTSADVS